MNWLERLWDRIEERDARKHMLEHEIMALGNPYLKGRVTRFNHVKKKDRFSHGRERL